MKTPMNVFNTAMKKKNKNRKGFSLVELIVCLVIMAILAAALVPTLIGYIKQTRQSNSKNEAAQAVSASQTMASSAYADSNGTYKSNETGDTVAVYSSGSYDATIEDDTTKFLSVAEKLSEVDDAGGNIVYVKIEDGVVTELRYTSKSGDNVKYTKSAGYDVVDSF